VPTMSLRASCGFRELDTGAAHTDEADSREGRRGREREREREREANQIISILIDAD
jgi:hypothetical protein